MVDLRLGFWIMVSV